MHQMYITLYEVKNWKITHKQWIKFLGLFLKNESQICSVSEFFCLWFLERTFTFYLYIYSPDSQENVGGTIHRASNYPDQLPEMPRHCCPLEILIEK